MMILTGQDIINTYNKRQQEQSRLYLEYKKNKKIKSKARLQKNCKNFTSTVRKNKMVACKQTHPHTNSNNQMAKEKEINSFK